LCGDFLKLSGTLKYLVSSPRPVKEESYAWD
jgi:hypothetical protein